MFFFISKLNDAEIIPYTLIQCPNCRQFGNLNRHDFLKGFGPAKQSTKAIRGKRLYCSNRGNKRGCGRTFALLLLNQIYNSMVNTLLVSMFLAAFLGQCLLSKAGVWKQLGFTPDPEWAYRILKRWEHSLPHIREKLSSVHPPPNEGTGPLHQTWLHLISVFERGDPIAQFQLKFQTSIFSN